MRSRIALLLAALFSFGVLASCSKPLPTADEMEQRRQQKDDQLLKDSGNE